MNRTRSSSSRYQPTSSSEYQVQQISDSGNPNLTVAVRIRPQTEREKNPKFKSIIKVLDEHVLVFDPAGGTDEEQDFSSSASKRGKGFTSNYGKARDYKYAFDKVFDQYATQHEVYEATTKSLIEQVLNGFNATVFAYGATGSGKTHTMIGNEQNGPGVMVLTMRDLFQTVEEYAHEKIIKVSISYLEVYNETIRDLLVENSPALMLCEEPGKGATVNGLSERHPKTAEEVFELLAFGNKNRRQSPTDANSESSRSHAVLQIIVRQKDRTADVSAVLKVGKLSLIDLAGSERAAVTQNRGERLKEGANINKSLLALGNCINSLGENYKQGKHVPYRNSKLTRLLKDSLGGNCKTVMIATVSPSSFCYEDTLNTLKYANRAKNIKTKVVRNVVNVNYHISNYTKIISDLRSEVSELKAQLQRSRGAEAAQEHQERKASHQASIELEEAKRQNARLNSDLFLLREIIREQHKSLAENNLVTPRMQQNYLRAIQVASPLPNKTKQAWVPVTPTHTSPVKQESPQQYWRPVDRSQEHPKNQSPHPPQRSKSPKLPNRPRSNLRVSIMSPKNSIMTYSPSSSLINSPFAPKSPRHQPSKQRPLSKQQLENIKENIIVVPKPKSILKKSSTSASLQGVSDAELASKVKAVLATRKYQNILSMSEPDDALKKQDEKQQPKVRRSARVAVNQQRQTSSRSGRNL